MSPKSLPQYPNLDHYKKRAKELLRRMLARSPGRPVRLADAQRELAREHGFASWPRFKHHVEAHARLQPNDRVGVITGPFAGFVGNIERAGHNPNEIMVELSLHSRTTAIWLDPKYGRKLLA